MANDNDDDDDVGNDDHDDVMMMVVALMMMDVVAVLTVRWCDIGLLFYSRSSDSAPRRLRFLGRLAQLVGGLELGVITRLGDRGPLQ